MESLIIATNAVVPFMVYIAVGIIARRAGWVKETFLRELNSVLFKVFFPFIMFNNLYKVDFSTLRGAGYVLFAFAGTLVVILLSFLTVPLFEKDNRRIPVIMQVFYRSNAVLFAIPLSASVLGDAASLKASIIVAFLVPLYNVSAVFILEYFRGNSVSFKSIIIGVLKTPLIVGAIAGALFNVLPLTMPDALAAPISQLSALATPMALFVLGGTLRISDVRKNAPVLFIGTLSKLVVLPAVMVSLMVAMNFEPSELFAVFCLWATPVAAASFPMAQIMGADSDLAGEYVVVTTLTSIITIFVWILILKNTGLI
jgi:predicted permease